VANEECSRIADQVRCAFGGDAWHGPALNEILEGVTAAQARTRPLKAGHTIWELVLHTDVYIVAALEAVNGIPMPRIYGTELDWPEPGGEWNDATDRVLGHAEDLAAAISSFSDERLQEIVPGRGYDFYHLFHGVVQHSLYHGGQIAMLKRNVNED
jgi:hypothetical protein